MPRRTPYMPGQSMYAGAWDVLMLTLDVGCSMGLSLNPPGGPAAVDAVARDAVPAARLWAQARRVVGARAAADAINRKRPRIVCRASRLGRLCLCDWVLASRGRRGYALFAVDSDAPTYQNVGLVASRLGLALQSKLCLALLSPDSSSRPALACCAHQ